MIRDEDFLRRRKTPPKKIFISGRIAVSDSSKMDYALYAARQRFMVCIVCAAGQE
ncbi:hypothetical protein [Parablautia intestinalis]|uniref:hypothetical protein n=1 Tax=Parablautia intestinalis TaxID=2320100 RepID=UPI00256F3B16|nr:hypothetical protein [Parablautia intestinalis]